MEATPEQAAEGAAIVRVLADVLNRLVVSNAGLARQDPGQITKFHALKAPGIGILPYLERIHKYASCSNECFILALIYIDRLIQRNNFLLTELNVHRVIITAILLAAKFFDDAYYNNAYYSKVGGVLVSEMNGLEVDFLFRINFSLHVTPEVFEKYKAELVAHSMQAVPQHVPTVSPQMPPIEEPSGSQISAYSNAQPLAAAPIGLAQHSSHHQPQQVTPSVIPQNVSSGGSSTESMLSAAQALEQQAALVVAERQLLHQQQLLHRANSLPPFASHGGGCSYSSSKAPPPFSAPMVSMLPVGTDDQYLLAVGQQLLPLQTTLVHHHHGQAVGGAAYQ
eukprot:CAMPEP_0176050264 /NCGR_PEP_ID=MMETSP0120_2-20121206/24982_1 /TAXON_ID=160619 /ORGANISM="Kryptoperidinium foliaceum, Strain CCMP 1326" /LENGTH=336 /DNA_ID=CAMNT_0017383697 /DNA_START=615 /DNA_END=1622 /DNA_ORIENTATION=-